MSATETPTTATDPAATAVTATFTEPLRGTDMVETFTVIRGELGAPHLSVLPVLGDRGPQAEPLARTCAMLDSLYADRQPHGWRITSVPGKDSRAARIVLQSDVNVMADVIGHESDGDRGPVLTSIVGPISLAAGVHVHNAKNCSPITVPGASYFSLGAPGSQSSSVTWHAIRKAAASSSIWTKASCSACWTARFPPRAATAPCVPSGARKCATPSPTLSRRAATRARQRWPSPRVVRSSVGA
ncbi:hypothetical protein [Kocuria atrinae]|uniref:hypothetical protein n=1 Tax=Kocuria atrinae TaxID=592377 RepID=UPI00030AFFC1|nr:hypothetical protein [Kocuria atrinae]